MKFWFLLLFNLVLNVAALGSCASTLRLSPDANGTSAGIPPAQPKWFVHIDTELIYSPVEPHYPGEWARRRLTLVALRDNYRRNAERFGELLHNPQAEGRAALRETLNGMHLFEAGALFYAALDNVMAGLVETLGQQPDLTWLPRILPNSRRRRIFHEALAFPIHLFEQIHFLEMYRRNYELAMITVHGPAVAILKALTDKKNPLPTWIWEELAPLNYIPTEYEDDFEGDDAVSRTLVELIRERRETGESARKWPSPKKVFRLADRLEPHKDVPVEYKAWLGSYRLFLSKHKLAPPILLHDALTLIEQLYVEPYDLETGKTLGKL
jgi:hypothetical protein